MKRQLKTLIIALSAVLALLIAVIIFDAIAKREGNKPIDTPAAEYNVVAENYKNLVKIEIENKNDKFVIEKDEDDVLSIAEFKGFPQSTGNYTIVSSGVSNFVTKYKIENPEDLDAYGLKAPQATAHIHYSSGRSYKIFIGNQADYSAGMGYYSMLEGDNNVYVLDSSTAELLICPKINYISLVLSNSTSEDLISDVNSVSFSGTDVVPFTLSKAKITYDGLEYDDTLKINKPYDIYVEEEKMEAVLSSLLNLFANEVEKLGTTSADLQKYGLLNPSCKVTINKGSDETLVISVGGKSPDGKRYIMTDKYDVVFKVLEENIANFSKIAPKNVMSTRPVVPSIFLVKNLIVETGGKSYNFQITSDPNDTGYIKIKLDGKEIDEANFKKFYATTIDYEAVDTAAPGTSGEKELTITYVYRDSATPSDKIEFYYNDARQYKAVKNGESYFITNYNGVKNIITRLEKLIKGESIGDIY